MQFVTKIRRARTLLDQIQGQQDADLRAALNEHAASAGQVIPGEIRGATRWEVDAAADVMVALRDHMGLTDPVTFHVCRHDEGINDCSDVAETRAVGTETR